MTNTLYMLIGLPGTGKSTWVAANHPNAPIISSDWYLELWAKEEGITYQESFQKYAKMAMDAMWSFADFKLRQNQEDLVWDQTNMNPKTRKKKIGMAKAAGYNVIAVVFSIPDDLHQQRLNKRENETGKVIPQHVITGMANSYVAPSKEEGFDKIIYVRD